MIRYHVRDLGHGSLNAGGINTSGAAVFSEIVSEVPGIIITSIASIRDPEAPVVRFPNEFVSSHHPSWDFFSTSAGGINKDGIAIGTAETTAPNGGFVPILAIKVQPTSLIRRLEPLPGFTSSVGHDINDADIAVGLSSNQDTSVATRWGAGNPERIDSGLTNSMFSSATAINSSGTIAGIFSSTPGVVRAWMRDNNGTINQNLGPSGGSTFATDINDAGTVVGATRDQRAWFQERSGAATVLSFLPGVNQASALGINDAGAIVGSSDVTACLWDRAQDSTLAAIDLNTRSTMPDNGRLIRAMRINNSGLILCEGHSDLGPRRVYLLIPYVTKETPKCVVADRVLMSLEPRAGTFGVNLPCRGIGEIPQGVVPVSRLCQLVSGGALDCPGCMRLLDVPCGVWGLSVEGVPDGAHVTLIEGKREIGELRSGKPRRSGKPFVSKAGKRTLEIVFSPSGRQEYFLGFRGRKGMKSTEVFPVRLTMFRADEKEAMPAGRTKSPKAAKSPRAKKRPTKSRAK